MTSTSGAVHADEVVERLIGWFTREGADLPWRRDARPLAGAGVRGDAPGDPGRPRGPLLRALHGALARARGHGARRRSARCWRSGRGSATPGAARNLHAAAAVVAERGWPGDLTDLPGRGRLHGGGDPLLRRRGGRAAARHQRRAGGRAPLRRRLARRARPRAGRPARRSWTSAGCGAPPARRAATTGARCARAAPAADEGRVGELTPVPAAAGPLRGLDAPAPRRAARRAGVRRLGRPGARPGGRGEPGGRGPGRRARRAAWCGWAPDGRRGRWWWPRSSSAAGACS